MYELIRDCFVTGKWEKEKDAANLLAEDDAMDDDDGSSLLSFFFFLNYFNFILEELFGDFEDLETGERHNEENDEMDEDGKIKF